MALVTFETDRLILRPFTENDVDVFTKRIFGDPEVMRYLPKRDNPPRVRAERNIEFFNQHWAEYGYGPWAVVEKASGELMGHCGLRYLTEIQETELLYGYGKAFWGKGYGTEAAKASVEYGFQQLGLPRIVALAVPENIGSRRVMEHCGLKLERETIMFEMDVVYYALNRPKDTPVR